METCDYLVIGAGSAGCVVASRLSEDPAARVLLLEAGGEGGRFWITTPAGIGKVFFDKRVNWCFATEPEPTLGGRSIPWPRGKVLGGTSAINGMVYHRGNPGDYDHWASLGNRGWGWQDVLPCFKRSEGNVRGASDEHAADGPLHVEAPAVRHPTTQSFIDAAAALGIPRSNDNTAAPFEGAGYQQFTIRNGRRVTSYDAFIAPVRHRRNLTVRTGMHVLRIVFEGREAVGVEVLDQGAKRIIRAAREVIVCTGALGAPHLLMLSGIGEAAALREQGIAVVHDLPGVGRNLQDHWFAPINVRSTHDSSYNHRLRGWRKYLEGMRYLATHKGYLALGASPVSAYIRSSDDEKYPDLQLAMAPVIVGFDPSGAMLVKDFPGISGSVVLLRPRSRGHVRLRSPDPLQAPAFQGNYLSDPDDVRRTVIGMRRLRQIYATAPLAQRVVSEEIPGAGCASDEQLAHHLRTLGNCGWHQVGTCKMGSDPLAVVDDRLRVHGVQRLRVIDASIMPTLVSGNTSAPAMMIGEKGADLVRQDEVAARAL